MTDWEDLAHEQVAEIQLGLGRRTDCKCRPGVRGERRSAFHSITELCVTRRGSDPTVGNEKRCSPALLWWIRPLRGLSAATNPHALK